MHKAQQQQQAEQELTASEFGLEADDPFAALGDNEDQDNEDPFSLDEDEQDITAFGRRSNTNGHGQRSDQSAFSVSRGISNLFSAGHRSHEAREDFGGSMDDSSSSDSGSDIDAEHPPLEARTSLERRPIDDDEDEDEEMGDMVAPSDEPNSSDEEALSVEDKQRLGIKVSDEEDGGSEFSGQDDHHDDDDGEALVEIAMPKTNKRRSTGSIS